MNHRVAEISASYAPTQNGNLLQAIRAGLPTGFAQSLMQALEITKLEMLQILAISSATFDRRMKSERFIAAESDRLYRVANLAEKAEDTLGSIEKARRWIHQPNRSLSGDTPLSRLDTEIGYQQTLDLLMRIEHGVYS